MHGKKVGRSQCWFSQIEALINQNNIAEALDTVGEIYSLDSTFAPQCHSFMHEIGQNAYTQYKESGTFSVSSSISLCTYGFYHGFLETIITTTGDYAEAQTVCTYIDEQLSESGLSTDSLTRNCYHGIGHGAIDDHLAEVRRNPFVTAEKTLALCRAVMKDSGSYNDCAGGVFNGIAEELNTAEPSELRATDPLALCEKQSEADRLTCYSYMARVVLHMYPRIDEAFAHTDIVTGKEKYYLVSNLAQMYVQRLVREGNELRALDACGALDSTLRKGCVEGMARAVVQSSGPAPSKKIIDFCSQTPDSDAVTLCYRAAVYEVGRWYTEDATNSWCDQLLVEKRLSCSTLLETYAE